jgi:hypothetical protein
MHDGWMAQEKCTIPVLTIDATRNFLDPEVMDDIFAELDTFIHGLE